MAISEYIRPDLQHAFSAQGLRTFDDFMMLAAGGTLNGGGRSAVQRISLDSGPEFYIKMSTRANVAVQLRLLLLGHANCGPLREKRLLDRLQAAGFATMEPVAWGEKRICGMPIAGFLVTRAVVGCIVADWYHAAGDSEKRQIMEQVGQLLGRLHADGFYQPVRLKDIIDDGATLVLIDRETSKPWSSRFSMEKSERAIVRSLRRTIRDAFTIGAGSANAFLRGYVSTLSVRCCVDRTKMRRRLVTGLRRELAARRTSK